MDLCVRLNERNSTKGEQFFEKVNNLLTEYIEQNLEMNWFTMRSWLSDGEQVL